MFRANLFGEKARLNYCKILTNGLQSDQRKPQSDETQLFEVENIWKFASHSLSLSTSSAWTNWLRNSSVCFSSLSLSLSLTQTERRKDRQKGRKAERQLKKEKEILWRFFLILFSRFHSISCSYPIGAQACVRKKELSRKTNLRFFGFFWD